MYYDTVETKEKLMAKMDNADTTYNSGLIIRTSNKEVYRFGIERTGDDLIVV